MAKGLPDRTVQKQLYEWAATVLERDFPNSPLSASAILDEKHITVLSSYGEKVLDRLEMLLMFYGHHQHMQRTGGCQI